MIDSETLLEDLQREVSKLEDDLRARCNADATVDAPLKAQYDAARGQQRTALTYKAWREDELTNVAVAWILASVFVRFLEDNGLVEMLHLAGPDAAGLGRARDQHEVFFRQHPNVTDREYLQNVISQTAALPGMKEFFDRRHNPLWLVGPTGDAAAALVNFWRKANPETGRPIHDFSDPEWNTRFLGDLYQDLSEAARKRYALLQTPVFVEEFILDRTLTPAIETFGFREVRMIDPTCGSGHFLLGGFARLHTLWVQAEPAETPAVLAQRALDQVFGVDLNPNVVAIARFRLLLSALRATGTSGLRDAFDFRINVVTGDALLHGRRFGEFEHQGGTQRTFDTEELFRDELKHHYEAEDGETLRRILGQQYHAVVGNPPYINVKDSAVSELYRARFPSCHRKYSLSVPFMERFFDLAIKGDGTPQQAAGFVGQITANSFMKAEFGKKLIEDSLPRWDITHVLDTSGAHIPEHGTPTVIIFGKNQPPVSNVIRTVMGIKAEPGLPADAAKGQVWLAIVAQCDQPGSVGEFVSAGDTDRQSFHRHPWNVGGGGIAELKVHLEVAGEDSLDDHVEVIGVFGMTNSDEVMLASAESFRRIGVEADFHRRIIDGDEVRDWMLLAGQDVVFPYTNDALIKVAERPGGHRWLWPSRTVMGSRATFGKSTYFSEGRPWWEWHQVALERLQPPLTITFAFVATHNHFVLETKGAVFNRPAPVIKLPQESSENDYARLLGVLNSSVAGFWLRQVCQPKGGSGIARGVQDEAWEGRYSFNGTQVGTIPVPAHRPTQIPTTLVQISTALHAQSPAATLASWSGTESGELRTLLAVARSEATRLRRQLVAWQEELDWQIYEAFGLIESKAGVSLPEAQPQNAIPPDGLELGQRAFEIVLARRMDSGEVQTTWFERHGSTPITQLPSHWPAPYRSLVERRIDVISDDSNIRLIEQPEYKRRWNTEPWDEQFTTAAREWLLARLEGYFHGGQRVCELKDGFEPASGGFSASSRPALTTTNQLAGTAQSDAAFLTVAEALMAGPGFSVPKLVRELVESASVPFLPVQRYKPSGLLKRRDWEQVWDLQRREDVIDADEKMDEPGLEVNVRAERNTKAAARKKVELGDVPVPPKYGSGDFKKSVWWSLRGKLDVPKERWILYPGAERAEDPSPVIAWAGWDHAQQARALAEYYEDAKQNFGFTPDKLKLLLAGLLELEPWLSQWHNAVDPVIGDSPANAIRAFLDAECHALGITRADLEAMRMGS